MLTTASGLPVPPEFYPGAVVFFFNDAKCVEQSGYILSVGEGTCQVQVLGGPELTLSWRSLASRPL